MFDETNEPQSELPADPAARAKEKAAEFRMHAELAAIYEGPRKFDAQVLPNLDPNLARELQRSIGLLEKAKNPESPLLHPPADGAAAALFALLKSKNLSTNDYHINRRPGEVLMVRWLEGEQQVSSFYERFQAHFDAALEDCRTEERETHGWKKDPKTLAYLAALDAVDHKMADRYAREAIKIHRVYLLSTLAVDEMDIFHLCDHLMNTPAAEVVGDASAPPEEPTEHDRAWFFKFFSLRGVHNKTEQMFFFTYLQKSDY